MHDPCTELKIESNFLGADYPAYFIADIAANHDGDIGRAKELIYMAKEAGADAAKFQHFRAESIVSDYGFKSLGDQKSHQATWKNSVFEVYKAATVSAEWTKELKDTCNKAGITFFTSPYDFELVDHIDPYVPAYKIGSGDITWIEMIEYIASKYKPYIIATGASSMDDIYRAVVAGLKINPQIVLLQCNTNYTGSIENMRFVQLNVLKSYRAMFPKMILGLSDHTPGHATVLGAIALGAKVIEKHFTDDTKRVGPDHAFSMDPNAWKDMVYRTRELEAALGTGVKKIEKNELETVILQRRSLCARLKLEAGKVLSEENLIPLRPCPPGAYKPYEIADLIGRKVKFTLEAGQPITDEFLER
jgi:sialic acid synthase SpsE